MKKIKRLIMGKNCLFEVLKSAKSTIIEVFTLKGNEHDPLYLALKKHKIPIKHLQKLQLSEMVHSTSHQNYVASVTPRTFLNPKEFLKQASEKEQSVVLMLDSIFDPHNFGAILRAAECFSVDAVIYSKNRGADLTPVVSKVSSGASELVPLMRVSNLAETLKLFSDQEFTVITADVTESAVTLKTFAFPEKSLIILGSEGKGVQQLLKKKSDYLLQISMQGKIDSLNVSQAAAVLLYAYRSSCLQS